MGRVENRREEERRSEKRKSEKKEDAGERVGKTSAIPSFSAVPADRTKTRATFVSNNLYGGVCKFSNSGHAILFGRIVGSLGC